jgi:hypothetical protein
MAITIFSWLPNPSKSLGSIVCSGQEATKCSKDTLRPDFQVNTLPMFFYKCQCHHKKQEVGCKKIQVYFV